ncbi:MAG: hypothetical protein LUG55_08000 [Clostridiales bacterium]|nr:hypothetical protein [Clostridiales bacterium]
MFIIEKNEGEKIPYEVNGTKVCFDDDLSVDLAKRQKDYDTQIDICYDADGDLTTSAKSGIRYVAQIDIPAAVYASEDSGEEATQTKQPLDMDSVTLTLWAID